MFHFYLYLAGKKICLENFAYKSTALHTLLWLKERNSCGAEGQKLRKEYLGTMESYHSLCLRSQKTSPSSFVILVILIFPALGRLQVLNLMSIDYKNF